MLDVLSGYEVGDTTWAPPPRGAVRRGGEEGAGPAPHRLTPHTRHRRRARSPRASRPFSDAAQLLTELGHDVEEIAAPWGAAGPLQTFIMAFGTPIAMGLYFGGMVTGREPSAGAGGAALVARCARASATAVRSTTSWRARS